MTSVSCLSGHFELDRKHLDLLDKDMHWVVEPWTFSIMAGASSTDIRQKGTLEVVDYATREADIKAVKAAALKESSKGIQASANQNDVQNVIDDDMRTAWQAGKGEYITFALKNDKPIDRVSVAVMSRAKADVRFKVQLSSGGGQFLDVYSAKVSPSEFGKLIPCTFTKTTASDLRILLDTDGARVAEVKF